MVDSQQSRNEGMSRTKLLNTYREASLQLIAVLQAGGEGDSMIDVDRMNELLILRDRLIQAYEATPADPSAEQQVHALLQDLQRVEGELRHAFAATMDHTQSKMQGFSNQKRIASVYDAYSTGAAFIDRKR